MGAYGPLAIMLEDLHHFDSISWSFLTTVAEKMSDQVLMVTTMRPNDGVLSIASRHEEGKMQPQLLGKPSPDSQTYLSRSSFLKDSETHFPRFSNSFSKSQQTRFARFRASFSKA